MEYLAPTLHSLGTKRLTTKTKAVAKIGVTVNQIVSTRRPLRPCLSIALYLMKLLGTFVIKLIGKHFQILEMT